MVPGKSVALGGRGIIEKKRKREECSERRVKQARERMVRKGGEERDKMEVISKRKSRTEKRGRIAKMMVGGVLQQ